MSLTWQGKLIVVVVAAAMGASVFSDRAAREEVHALASLTPCGLAHHYVDWRFEFERGLNGATSIEGRQLTAFVNRNAQYAKAAQEVMLAPNASVTRALWTLANFDSDRKNSRFADMDPFLDAFFETCFNEAMAFAFKHLETQ